MKVTSIDELKAMAKGEIVELKGFGTETFVARLRRPSLLNMVTNSKIPNTLLSASHTVFFGAKTSKDVVSMDESNQLYRIVAKEALVEPTLEQIEEAGLELTDEQLIEIFQYTQVGVRALESFHKKQKDIKNTENKQ